MAENLIKINLLGDCCISCENVQIDSTDLSGQLCNLCSYLVTHRGQKVTCEEISTILWPEDIKNSSGALKNLVYRLRKVMEDKNFPHYKAFLASDRGSYKLNPKLNFEIDIDEFERLLTRAVTEMSPDKRAQLLIKATNMYSADFIPALQNQPWTVSYRQKYHDMFFVAVYSLLDIFSAEDKFDEVETLAKRASSIDPFEENVHKYIMLCLHKKGMVSEAMNYYKQTRELFYRELGIELSDSTRQLYNELSKSASVVSVDIVGLQEYFMETDDEAKDTFYCELEAFRQIYRFTARALERMDNNFFMGLITISGLNGEELEMSVREKAMDQLCKSIQGSLRRGDVFSRCSPNQYAIMLPARSFENASEILQRTAKSFKLNYHSRKVSLTHNLQTISPPKA